MPEILIEHVKVNNGDISQCLRRWGLHKNETDVGLLTFEHEDGKVFAIIEYKNEHAIKQYASHPTYRAVINLGDRAGIPVIVCRYNDDFSRYVAVPLNMEARRIIPNRTEYDEIGWVKELYRLRGREVPEEVLTGMKVEI